MTIHAFINTICATSARSVAASLDDRTVNRGVLSPATATCYYRIGSNGTVYGGASTATSLETWLDLGVNTDFEVYFDHISGSIPALTNITFDTWQATTLDRTMALGRSGIGTSTAVIDVSIRNAATGAVLTTATITMNATVLNPA